VSANGTQEVTDSAGQVRLPKTSTCLRVEVKASGFLERRTCSHSAITLWPVANEEEREATRSMAFRDDRLQAGWLAVVSVTEELGKRPEVVQTWTSAANEIERLTSDRMSFSFVEPFPRDYPDGGPIIGPAAATPDCHPGLSRWPIETGGFCGQWSPEHDNYVLRLNVLPDRLTDSSVAVRALLVGARGMSPHAMPGLMNRNRPDRELSTFERKTLHMIALRYGQVRWPDLDGS
jgi:hypothetical protein